MDAQALRRRIRKALLDKMDDTRFPSTMMLDRVEKALATPDDAAEYAEILLKKLEDTRYPSTDLLTRLDAIAARLPAPESSR